MWQDYVILVGSIVAITSLVPILLDEEAVVPYTTSVPTVFVLLGQSVAFYTIGLVGSALGAVAGFVLWTFIAVYKSPSKEPRERAESTTTVRPAD
ncbi:hypothetical protein [Halomarina pelagica]|uniref:hypothetical protein n=1 Tax=Halomarina pelagica TaxID=2961599 RepID=UPI0020C351FF|nr:hypothetical protein [Halomarina sp. BND7]